MEKVRAEINKEIKTIEYYIKSNLERGKGDRVTELEGDKTLLLSILDTINNN